MLTVNGLLRCLKFGDASIQLALHPLQLIGYEIQIQGVFPVLIFQLLVLDAQLLVCLE